MVTSFPYIVCHLEFGTILNFSKSHLLVRNNKGQIFAVGFGIHQVLDTEVVLSYLSDKGIKHVAPDNYQLTEATNPAVDSVRELKQLWDPRNLLNPGKL
jgi:hypothetical protein